MDIGQLARRFERIVTDNSPTILTGIGVAGTVLTAFQTGHASLRASRLIEEEHQRININRLAGEPRARLDRKEKFKLVWQEYIPAVATGTITIAAIIGANRIGTRRTAALAAAYSVMERATSEYKEKVIERLGEGKERKLRSDLAHDRVHSSPYVSVLEGPQPDADGKVWCHEAMTGRFFRGTMEEIMRAQNDINELLLNGDGSASLTMFYNHFGDRLPPTSVSDEMGWNSDKPLRVATDSVLYQDRIPCLSFDYAVVPHREYWRFI